MGIYLNPLGDYVVAQPEVAKEQTKGGIYLPSSTQEKQPIAVVLALADKVKGVQVGDRIIYKSYSQTEVKVNDEVYLLIKEEDILSTIN